MRRRQHRGQIQTRTSRESRLIPAPHVPLCLLTFSLSTIHPTGQPSLLFLVTFRGISELGRV